MNVIGYAILGFWIAAIFGVTGFLARKKKCGPFLQGLACTVLFIAVLLAGWWGVLRAFDILPR